MAGGRFIAVLVLLAGTSFAQQQSDTDRLIAIGKLWATVKYFHPNLANENLGWDKTLVEALPKIRAAKTNAEYAKEVQTMLDHSLHDQGTYVITEPVSSTPASLKIDKAPNGTLIVSQAAGQPTSSAAEELAKAVRASNDILFDLRAASASPDYLSHLLDDDLVAKELILTGIETPGQRRRMYQGFVPENGHGSGAFHSGSYIVPGPQVPYVAPPGPQHKIMFILDETSHMPGVGCALFDASAADVWAELPSQSEAARYQSDCAETTNIDLGQGIQVVVRLSQPVFSRAVTLAPKRDIVTQAITALAKRPVPGVRNPHELANAAWPKPDNDYPETAYPSPEYRILAAYKTWAVFHYFFAYRDLMDEDWDEVFATFLPKFIAAKDAREYNLTLSEMITHAADSHVSIESKELTEYFGAAPVGLRLRLIEKKPVITEILDDEAAKAGIRVGDIVSKVDGESIVDRFNRESPYVASSTPQWHGYRVIERILNGPEGSTAALTVGGQDGRTREINLKRRSTYAAALRNQRTGEMFKQLPGNIGYADLDRLTPEQVDAMFDKFRDTKAIIFDMRGDPHETAQSIAPRLTDDKEVATAIFTGPLTLGPDLPRGEMLTSSASYFFVQKLPATDKWKFKGKTVMLIDERTIGQAEHTGLLFEAANKTEFIGTPSAGADGDVTNFVVPGGITISFSGRDVRHANGGKLQRLGLQPSVNIAPTINGIRHGQDEVLDKALEYLSK